MKNAVRILALILLLGGVAGAGYPQTGPFSTDIGGSPYKDDSQRAADHYARGVRLKSKAEKESEPEKRAKLYQKAREELLKSIGLDSSYDALMALGKVYMGLGNAFSSLEACSQALHADSERIRPGIPTRRRPPFRREGGHPFRDEGGHPFRGEGGHFLRVVGMVAGLLSE